MSQPPPAPTVNAVGPCATLIQISRTPRHWKFTQHHRTTRPPPLLVVKVFLIFSYLFAVLQIRRDNYKDNLGIVSHILIFP